MNPLLTQIPSSPLGWAAAAVFAGSSLLMLRYALWAFWLFLRKTLLALSFIRRGRRLYADRRAVAPSGGVGLLCETFSEMRTSFSFETAPMRRVWSRMFLLILWLFPALIGLQTLRFVGHLDSFLLCPKGTAVEVGHWSEEGFVSSDGKQVFFPALPFAYAQITGEILIFNPKLAFLGLHRYHRIRLCNFFYKKPHSLPVVPNDSLQLGPDPLFQFIEEHQVRLSALVSTKRLVSLTLPTKNTELRLVGDTYAIVPSLQIPLSSSGSLSQKP